MHHEQSALNLKPILYQGPSLERFSFASLVYYQDYLRSLTSPRFLNTPLVTQAILRGQLFPWVECQLPKPSYGICATGTSFDDYNDWTAGSLRKGYEVFHRNCSKNKVPRADVVKRDALKRSEQVVCTKLFPPDNNQKRQFRQMLKLLHSPLPRSHSFGDKYFTSYPRDLNF